MFLNTGSYFQRILAGTERDKYWATDNYLGGNGVINFGKHDCNEV